MSSEHYKKALEAARKELADLEAQRAKLDKRINELRQGIVGLSALTQDEESGEKPQSIIDVLAGTGVDTGLTDAVRMATNAFGLPMTPVQVRDTLIALGYNLSGYSNIVASLHTIMKRLARNGELIVLVDDGGKEIGAYQWNPAQPPPQLTRPSELRNVGEIRRVAEAQKRERGRSLSLVDLFSGQGGITPMTLGAPPCAGTKKKEKLEFTDPPYAEAKKYPEVKKRVKK